MSFDYWQKFVECEFYHIYNRSIDGLILFKDPIDYQFFLRKYAKYLSPYFHTYAYCLIPNHFHFLIQVKSQKEIHQELTKENTKTARSLIEGAGTINNFVEDQMRRFFSSIALSYNKKFDRRGPVFSEKTKRVAIQNEAKLFYLLTYIHHNPIHHKLCSTYKDWKFSSYNSYLSNQPTMVARTEMLKELGGVEFFLDHHRNFKMEFKNNLHIDL